MFEVEYLWNGWVKKDGVNANYAIGLILYIPIDFAFSTRLSSFRFFNKTDLELYCFEQPYAKIATGCSLLQVVNNVTRHFFERSCIVCRRNDKKMGPTNSVHAIAYRV